MGLADVAVRGILTSLAFRASAAPYLLLDTDLRVKGANRAYEGATLRHTGEMIGELIFDVFPDNPATPEARGVERLGDSLERALITGEPDRMELQRYDVRDPLTGTFIEKSWLPRNAPIRNADGRVLGLLHHVEDVTHRLAVTALEHDLLEPIQPTPEPLGEVSARIKALRESSMARRAEARVLVERSRQAIERMSRWVEDAEPK